MRKSSTSNAFPSIRNFLANPIAVSVVVIMSLASSVAVAVSVPCTVSNQPNASLQKSGVHLENSLLCCFSLSVNCFAVTFATFAFISTPLLSIRYHFGRRGIPSASICISRYPFPIRVFSSGS